MNPLLRRVGRRVARSASVARAIDGLARAELRATPPSTLSVLTYHRIARFSDRPDLARSLRSTDPAGFRAQIELLAEHHHFVSIDDVLRWRRTGESAPPRAVLLTFDDTYEDLADHVWPLLRERDIPAVAFVPTGYVDTGRVFWWDALHLALTATTATRLPWRSGPIELAPATDTDSLARRLRAEVKALPHHEAIEAVDKLVAAAGVTPAPAPVLSWDRLRALHAEGLTLAPHTRNHAFLDRLDPAEARSEVEGSMADLEDQIGTCPPVFAYPSGQWNPVTRQIVADAGIELAFTTRRGVNPVPAPDWLALDRINVGAAASPAVVQAQLLRSTGPLVRRLSP